MNSCLSNKTEYDSNINLKTLLTRPKQILVIALPVGRKGRLELRLHPGATLEGYDILNFYYTCVRIAVLFDSALQIGIGIITLLSIVTRNCNSRPPTGADERPAFESQATG